MSHRRALFLLGAALLLAGCMNVSSTLTVRPDGSGTMTERFVLNAEVVRMMESMEQAFDSTATGPALFSEEERRAEADSLPGLSLQSFTRIDDTTGQGYEAVYAFDNLNDISFDPGPSDGLPDEAMETDESPLDLMSELSFDFTPGTPATLTVHMPLDAGMGEGDAEAFGPSPEDDLPSDEELSMMRALMANAGFRVAVQIEGQIVETNATHRSGSTVTLLAMDFGALARDSTAFREMMTLPDDSTDPAVAIERLNGLPGVAIEPQETVTIRFR